MGNAAPIPSLENNLLLPPTTQPFPPALPHRRLEPSTARKVDQNAMFPCDIPGHGGYDGPHVSILNIFWDEHMHVQRQPVLQTLGSASGNIGNELAKRTGIPRPSVLVVFIVDGLAVGVVLVQENGGVLDIAEVELNVPRYQLPGFGFGEVPLLPAAGFANEKFAEDIEVRPVLSRNAWPGNLWAARIGYAGKP